MQIVIDIPENLYESVKLWSELNDDVVHPQLGKIFQNGIPLPKGHGSGGKDMSDLINRQDAIDAVDDCLSYVICNIHMRGVVKARVKDALKRLPSAPPNLAEVLAYEAGQKSAERKKGEWIHREGGYSDHYECSACGQPIVLTGKWNYCPMCGADMRGESNDEMGSRAKRL